MPDAVAPASETSSGNKAIASDKELGAAALEVAISQLGVSEVPKNSNRGPEIKKYLNSVGLPEGYAWCMAFVYWCFKKASERAGIPVPFHRTAGVADCWNKTALSHRLTADNMRKRTEPLPAGTLVIFKFKTGWHVGMVESSSKTVRNEIELLTIEGNTNDEGSREGFEVCRRKRMLNESIVGFLLP